MRSKIIVNFPVSDWVAGIEHDQHGVLTVHTKAPRGTYKFRAPVEVARQAQRIADKQAAGKRVSAGKWLNTAVIGMYPRIDN